MTPKEIAIHAAWHYLFQTNPTPDVVLTFFENQKLNKLDWFWQPEVNGNNKTLLDMFLLAVNFNLTTKQKILTENQSTWSNVWDIVKQQLPITQEIGEKIIDNLVLLPNDDALVLHIVDQIPLNIWRNMSVTKKSKVSLNAVRNWHESILKKLLENGQDPNEVTDCLFKETLFERKIIKGPLLADARSHKIASCLLNHGANPEIKMQNGTTVLAFLKSKDPKLFNSERNRKLTWDVVEKAAMTYSMSSDFKKNTCLESIQVAKTPAEIKFALKKFKKDEWRYWSIEGGGTLVHYIAFVNPLLFDVAFKALNASQKDLQTKDEKGADPYTYFICSGVEPIQLEETKENMELEKILELFAKNKTTVDLTSKEGIMTFSEHALHILQHMPKKTNKQSPLSWARKQKNILEQLLFVSDSIRQGIVPSMKNLAKHEVTAQKLALIAKWEQASFDLLNDWSFSQEDQWREVAQKHAVSNWLTSGWFQVENTARKSFSSSAKNILNEREQLRTLKEWSFICRGRLYNKNLTQQNNAELAAKTKWTALIENISLERWIKIQDLVEKNILWKSNFGEIETDNMVWAEAKNIVERQLLINKTSDVVSISTTPSNAL